MSRCYYLVCEKCRVYTEAINSSSFTDQVDIVEIYAFLSIHMDCCKPKGNILYAYVYLQDEEFIPADFTKEDCHKILAKDTNKINYLKNLRNWQPIIESEIDRIKGTGT